MKKLYKILLISLLPICSITSCTNLDEKVYSSISADNFFRNEEEVMLNVGRVYAQLRQINNRWGAGSMSLITSGECIVPFRETNLWWDNGTWIDLYQHQFSYKNPVIVGGWNFCFNGITSCNQVLFQLENTPVNFDSKESIKSEIKVVRAFYFLTALDWFGNIPVTTDFTDVTLPSQKSRKEVFDFIEKELTENISLLAPYTTTKNYGRASQAFAYEMLAKLYINAQEWIGVPRWNDAIKATDAIIAMNHYVLSPDYFTNFAVDNSGSLENIFVVPYDKINTDGWDSGLIFHHQSLHNLSAQTFGFSAFCWDGYAATEDLYNSYDKKDKRINSWLEGPQYSATGAPLMLAPGRQLTYRAKVTSLFNTANPALLDDGVRIKKYAYEKDLLDAQSMSNDWVIYRYADVLLMKAEAIMRQGGVATQEAVDLVNQVRRRAFGDDTHNYTASTLTLDELLAERGRELAWEGGIRRQDVIRFGKWQDAWFEKPAEADGHTKLFPIPLQVLDVNKNLKQNSGY